MSGMAVVDKILVSLTVEGYISNDLTVVQAVDKNSIVADFFQLANTCMCVYVMHHVCDVSCIYLQ